MTFLRLHDVCFQVLVHLHQEILGGEYPMHPWGRKSQHQFLQKVTYFNLHVLQDVLSYRVIGSQKHSAHCFSSITVGSFHEIMNDAGSFPRGQKPNSWLQRLILDAALGHSIRWQFNRVNDYDRSLHATTAMDGQSNVKKNSKQNNTSNKKAIFPNEHWKTGWLMCMGDCATPGYRN